MCRFGSGVYTINLVKLSIFIYFYLFLSFFIFFYLFLLFLTGVKMAWNHHVHFELHGICSVLQGKGDFAIQEVKIAQTREVQHT